MLLCRLRAAQAKWRGWIMCGHGQVWRSWGCVRYTYIPWGKQNVRQSLNFVNKYFHQAIVICGCASIQSYSRLQLPLLRLVSQVVFRVSWMLPHCNLSCWQPQLPLNLVSSSPVDLKYSWHFHRNTWDLLEESMCPWSADFRCLCIQERVWKVMCLHSVNAPEGQDMDG